jgi:hypothetical protein
MIARIAVALQQPAGEGADAATQLHRLRQLCADLVALRKGDQNGQRLRLEREKLDLALNKSKADDAARQQEIDAAKKPGGVTKEFIEWFEKEFNIT